MSEGGFMKNKLVLCLLAGFLTFNAAAAGLSPPLPSGGYDSDQSSDDPDAEDPCVTVTCLYGKLTGNAQKECDPAVKAFKNIKATKKHGIFDPTKTLKKRTKFLNGCPSADQQAKDMVLKAYGKLKSI